jgi:hypothetical protein
MGVTVKVCPVELRQTPIGPEIDVGADGAGVFELPTVYEALAVQLPLFTVTLYVPGANPEMSSVVAPLLHV